MPFDEKAARAELEKVFQEAKSSCGVPPSGYDISFSFEVTFQPIGSGEGKGAAPGLPMKLRDYDEATRARITGQIDCVDGKLRNRKVIIQQYNGPSIIITHHLTF